ncbi:MAG: ABATE domain-containing protein, partial [Acidobacteriales bacterium]|nr:ABATE domain-containing protein [Terriglobales bacterium]
MPVREDEWRDGFIFLANNTALDFLNTCPVVEGTTQELLPDFESVLRWFSVAGLLTQAQLQSLRASRGESAYKKLLAFREE